MWAAAPIRVYLGENRVYVLFINTWKEKKAIYV